MHRTLVGDRLWDDARKLGERYPNVALQTLPDSVIENADIAGAAAWQVKDTGNEIERFAVKWPEGAALLLVSDPACRFSRAFLDALETDSTLLASLPAERMFVSPAFGTLGARRIGRWNESHPALTHVLVDRPDPWSEWVEVWDTPQLIFLFNGRVVARVSGWPEEGRFSEIQSALSGLAAVAASDGVNSRKSRAGR